MQGAWSYQVTSIGNGGGGKGLPVSSIYQAQSGGLIGTFYASYESAAGESTDVQFRLLLSSEGEIQGVTVSEAGSGGSAPVTLDGGRLTPYYIVPTDGGFDLQPADQSVPVSDTFQISFPTPAARHAVRHVGRGDRRGRWRRRGRGVRPGAGRRRSGAELARRALRRVPEAR